MTLPAPGVSLSLLQINTEFGYGTNLGAYLGKRWYQDNAATGIFSAPISIYDFYSKRVNSPVTPGSASYVATGYSLTVPLYSVLNITIRGGAGGGGGGGGNAGGGSGGGSGGTSTCNLTIGSYAAGGGGGGGLGNGVSGAAGGGSDGNPAGGVGGGGGYGGGPGGAGGAGGKVVLTLYNPVPGNPAPYGPAVGSTISGTAASGGAGGGGAAGLAPWPYPPYLLPQNGQNGAAGNQGSVYISWS